jgi:CheY-like chemotaxis protein
VAHIGEKLAPGAARDFRLAKCLGERRALVLKRSLELFNSLLQVFSHRVFFVPGGLMMNGEFSAPQRLLIVEDDVHMAYLLGYLAERERFAVETIADGRKAAERIDTGPAVDLVLLDVMLPYMDGFELLARIRANPAWQGVPVIILTSKTREHDAVRALSLGADDYLTKPFSPPELVARIRRRLRPPATPSP